MMRNILFNYGTSHTVPDGPRKIPVFPQFPRPKFLLQPWELAEQTPRTLTLNDSDNFSYRSARWKGQKQMHMLYRYFHLDYVKSIILADLSDKLSRSFPKIRPLKNLLTVFRTPYQMITRVVDRMTRSLNCHDDLISYCHTRAYVDKGDAPLPLYNPLGKACIHPRGKPRGILQRTLINQHTL